MPIPSEPITLNPRDEIRFSYKNWRGQTEIRRVKVISFAYGTSEWHTTPTMFMYAFDLSRNVYRYFAIPDIDAATIQRA